MRCIPAFFNIRFETQQMLVLCEGGCHPAWPLKHPHPKLPLQLQPLPASLHLLHKQPVPAPLTGRL